MKPEDIDNWKEFLEDNDATNIIDYGDWIMCNCLFHQQSHNERPSFGISKESGVGNCFGCGTHSWNEICKLFGISTVEFTDGIKESAWQTFKKKFKKEKKTVSYQRFKLPKHLVNPIGHKGAYNYLINRNHYDTGLLEQYNVRLCLDKNSKYYEYLIFPIEDPKGVLFFDARYVGIGDKTRWLRPKGAPYWKTYFNWVNVENEKILLFVEGVSDALKFIQLGLPAVPAKNFSLYQLQLIRKSSADKIFLFYDNDPAGRTLKAKNGKPIHFTAKAKHLLSDSGIDIRVGILPPNVSDPAEVNSLDLLLKYNVELKKSFG